MKRLPSPRLTRRVIITGQWGPVIYSPETCMHGLACTLPAGRAAIFSSSLPDYLPFLSFSSSLIGYRQALLWGLIVELTVYAPTRRVCFSPPTCFFVLSFCCVLAPCTLHLLAQSVATIAEGPPWLGTVRPAAPSGGHCVGWRAFPSSGGYKHTALTHVSSCCVCVAHMCL